LIDKVKAQRSHVLVWVAGNPASTEQLKEAGVDGFVHIRSNVLETLAELQDKLQVITDLPMNPMNPMSKLVPRLERGAEGGRR
jgi:methylmalonyl-CoA mutase cobalamin-binding subunit